MSERKLRDIYCMEPLFRRAGIPEDIQMHRPRTITDGGPWAFHDYACPVCQKRKAILQLHSGHFQPCDECSRGGWVLAQKPEGVVAGWIWNLVVSRP